MRALRRATEELCPMPLSNSAQTQNDLALPPMWPRRDEPLAMVFLWAKWSGPSVLAKQRLERRLASTVLAASEFVAIDVDEHPTVCDVPELVGKIHAWGEVAIVLSGEVRSLHILARQNDRLDEMIDGLLNEYFSLRNVVHKSAPIGDKTHG